MIVLDASTRVSATFNSHGVPAQVVERAMSVDRVAISEPVMTELLDVLYRPGIARFIKPERRSQVLGQLVALGVALEPGERGTDCRDAKDNKYLDLALAAKAEQIVSSNGDLLVLHPWRGMRILRPAAYLVEASIACWVSLVPGAQAVGSPLPELTLAINGVEMRLVSVALAIAGIAAWLAVVTLRRLFQVVAGFTPAPKPVLGRRGGREPRRPTTSWRIWPTASSSQYSMWRYGRIPRT